MDPITKHPHDPTIVGITLCADWYPRHKDGYYPHKEIPVHEGPGQKEEIIYWHDQAKMRAYLAGSYKLPVCPVCGREATACSQDPGRACDPVPSAKFDRVNRYPQPPARGCVECG